MVLEGIANRVDWLKLVLAGKDHAMPSIIEYLESLNRKERFFLIGTALGNQTFQLSSAFRDTLTETFGIQIPQNAFAAMDYHLDWIHASLHMAQPGNEDKQVHRNTDPVIITGNQEDVDLIVAIKDAATTHLLLLEAKAETNWTNKQLLSKASRLRVIFGEDGKAYPNVRPQFGLMSPRRPEQLETKNWPSWMIQDGKPTWFKLPVASGRRRVTRCDSERRQSATAGFFRISP